MIQYKITVKKAIIEDMRYGRTPKDGGFVRAPLPFLAPITKEWFLSGLLLVKANSEQLFVPTEVNDLDDCYELKGQLIFENESTSVISEESMLDYFIKNTEHVKHSATLYELKRCSMTLNLGNNSKNQANANKSSTQGLFSQSNLDAKRKEKLVHFNEMISSFFDNPPPTWLYNKAADTAFITDSNEKRLKNIFDFLIASGYPSEFVTLSKTKRAQQPILLITNFNTIRIVVSDNTARNDDIEDESKSSNSSGLLR